MNDLTFIESDHSYWVDGRQLPSVTQVLDSLGFIKSEWFTEESRIRGTLVHRLCELWDKDELDPLTVDPRLAGYLKAWQKFCRSQDMVWTAIEDKRFHRVKRYAGTPDRLGINRRGRTVTVDIKTGPPALWMCFQAGGYLDMDRTEEAYSVHLKEDGNFQIEEYDVRYAIEDWTAIYHTYTLLRKGK